MPLAIMTLRRAIVSHDAIINSATIRGSGRLRRELSFAMVRPCEEEATAGDEAARCQAYNLTLTIPTHCPAMAVRSGRNGKER